MLKQLPMSSSTLEFNAFTSIEWVDRTPPPVVYGLSNISGVSITVVPPPGTWTWEDTITEEFGVEAESMDLDFWMSSYRPWTEYPFDRAPGVYPGSYNYAVGSQIIPAAHGLVVVIQYQECRADESRTDNGPFNVEPGWNHPAFILFATTIDEEWTMVRRKNARVQRNHIAVPILFDILFEEEPPGSGT